jgi:uncharacterized cysteine cluster protein YcgN (CxxCxxCC family)
VHRVELRPQVVRRFEESRAANQFKQRKAAMTTEGEEQTDFVSRCFSCCVRRWSGDN